jgi:uncharacterized protein (DUF2252 family)
LPYTWNWRHGITSQPPALVAARAQAAHGRKPLVQLCGDAHLLNFGFYGSPDLQLLFDLNDFDETHPGPFEWDVIQRATR